MTRRDVETAAATLDGETRIPAERIRRRAYELWERHHCPPGFELRFWLLAERQLRDEAGRDAGEGEGTVMPPRDKPVYRAMILDPEGNVLGTEIVLAQTDSEALALAGAMAWEFTVELWDGLRFIEQIAPRREPSVVPVL